MNKALYRGGKRVVNWYAKTALDFEVAYQAPLPTGATLFVANHPTTLDPFLLTLITEKAISIMVHETLFKVPLFGRYLRAAGHIEVINGSGMAALSSGMRLLEIGRSVAIFPEGGISPQSGGLLKAHSGAARLALATGAQVVPVGIGLERERIRYIETMVDGVPEVARWYSGAYRMTAGKPTNYTGDINDWSYVNSVTQHMMDSIAALMRASESRLSQRRSTQQEEKHYADGRAITPA